MSAVRTTWTEERLQVLAWHRNEQRMTAAEIANAMALSLSQVKHGLLHLGKDRMILPGVALTSNHVAVNLDKGTIAPRTVKDFAKDQKRAACKVCALPAEAKAQLRDAPRELIVAWLREDYHAELTIEDLDRHRNERH